MKPHKCMTFRAGNFECCVPDAQKILHSHLVKHLLHIADHVLHIRRVNTMHVYAQAGLIINIGSIAGEMAMGPQSVYAATKWGLRGWSLSCYEVNTSHRLYHNGAAHISEQAPLLDLHVRFHVVKDFVFPCRRCARATSRWCSSTQGQLLLQ